ncbi:GGDEF domain-containing protein [Actinoplanes bogorensis]|uniref:GGDEF domain-containing protein n=1 Tax=Paractinoplanes bogorensis TaxID=1610840 RepID=A0ABS5YKM9_9ACTN|nr:GGDEF domain-containing protein [Actinoplanes bogorensis]MBU2664031.1 GGDEF domain-containing protein [Actinoplanes bogorensis]
MNPRARAAGALFLCALLQIWLTTTGHPAWLVVPAGLATTALAFAAAGRHAVLAHRETGRARSAWIFTSAATGLWALGSAFYTLDSVRGTNVAPPRLGDWLSLAAALLAPGVLLAGPSAPVARDIQVRLGLDGLMVATALFVPAWPLLLHPTQQLLGNAGGLLAISIPATHIVCLAIAVVLLSRSRAGAANAVTALAGAFAVFAASVLVYLAVALRGGSWQVHSMAGLFATATVLLLLAGRLPMPVDSRPWLEAPTGVRAALPYVPVVLAYGTAAVLQQRGQIDGVAVAAVLLLTALVLGRQFLALRTTGLLLAELSEQRRQLAHQATHDDLTGLANRKLLNTRIAGALDAGGGVALLLADLDGFKQVNDESGHPAGDDVLIRVAAALHRAVPPDALVARLGGDEFAILLHPASSSALDTASRVIDEVSALGESRVGVSVGVVHEPGGGATVSSLLTHADAALYEAKRAGKGCVRVYNTFETART